MKSARPPPERPEETQRQGYGDEQGYPDGDAFDVQCKTLSGTATLQNGSRAGQNPRIPVPLSLYQRTESRLAELRRQLHLGKEQPLPVAALIKILEHRTEIGGDFSIRPEDTRIEMNLHRLFEI